MRKVFISYADDVMKASLLQIGKQAKRCGLFDEIVLWTPEKLPHYIKNSPLMKYQRGGGYWCWKPIIIYETLQMYDENTIVIYSDAGCRVRKSFEWKMFFDLMKKYDTILFQYPDYMAEWEKWGQASSAIKYWVKKSCMLFLDEYIGHNDWHEENECLGSFIITKGKNNKFLNSWKDIILNHWDVILDPTSEERKKQIPGFAYHKHEQPIITALGRYDVSTLLLPELCETGGRKVGLYTSRIRAKSVREYYWIYIKQLVREAMGDSLFVKIKHLIGIKTN